MKTIVYTVNAFTANGRGGNPAGVVLDAGRLASLQMQAIATKMGFAETAFVSWDENANYNVRFFEPESEVDLCGHATIAAWSLMHSLNLIKPGNYTQITRVGELGIEIQKNGLVFMEQTVAEFGGLVPAGELAVGLGVALDDLAERSQPQIVSTGLSTVLVELRNKDCLNALIPDTGVLAKLCRKYNAILVHPYVISNDDASLAVCRNFGPTLGVIEDVATGTSNGALLCYLKQNKSLPDAGLYRIEQGVNMNQLSYIYGRFKNSRVWVGGYSAYIQQELVEA